MINKNINDVTNSDINNLLESQIPEGKTIEYKVSFSIGTDNEKGEFLADISSFANTSGGDILYGIHEEGGIPIAIDGIEIVDIDQIKLQIDNLIQDGLDPRIKTDIKNIQLENGNHVLLIRVHKSLIGPHRVIFTRYSKTKDQFYKRNSSGKYQLDTQELREEFNSSYNMIAQIKKFKRERLSLIIEQETPVPIQEYPKIVIHMIPFDFTQNYDVNFIYHNHLLLPPIIRGSQSRNINLEGIVTYSSLDENLSYAYAQIFRNGTIESVDSTILHRSDGRKILPSLYYECSIIESIQTYKETLKTIGVNCPIYIFITFIGIRGFKLGLDPNRFRHEYPSLNKDMLEIPEIIMENYTDDISKILKPAFDLVWNAFGLERSYHYNGDGIWEGNCS